MCHCLRSLILLSGLLTLYVDLKAGPLFFSDVRLRGLGNEAAGIDLFANPDALVVAFPDLSGPDSSWVSFGVTINGFRPTGALSKLRVSFDQDVLFPIPRPELPPPGRFWEFDIVPFEDNPPLNILFSLVVFPGSIYDPWPVSVMFDITNSAPDFIIPAGPRAGENVDSYTYSFSVVQQIPGAGIPEPAALLLVVSGMGALVVHQLRCRSESTRRGSHAKRVDTA